MDESIKQQINAIARAIALQDGWVVAPDYDFVASDSPRVGKYRRMAEAAWMTVYGDYPDYAED